MTAAAAEGPAARAGEEPRRAGGGAEGGAERRRPGSRAERGRASCAPARGPAVALGCSPGPAADPGKRRSQASGPSWGPGCCRGRRYGREDAQGAGAPSPSPRGALGSASRLARPGGSPEAPGGWSPGPARPSSPAGPPRAPRCGPPTRRRGHSTQLGRGGGGGSSGSGSDSSRCAAWSGAAGQRGSGANPEHRRHLQRPQTQRRRHPRAQVLQSAGCRHCRRGHHHLLQGQREPRGPAWQTPGAHSALR